jgi:TolB protein
VVTNPLDLQMRPITCLYIMGLVVLVGPLFQENGAHAQVEPVRPLFTINADGGGLKQLTQSPDRVFGSPDWSPDGKWIACDTWHLNEKFSDAKIALIHADGSGIRELGPGAMPSWSPNGTQLVCHTYESPQTIVVINADGSGRETILNHWGSPRWSPRGNRIASIGPHGTIALFDLATGKEHTIFRGPYSLWQGFSISPDGLRFCFGDSQGGIGLATLDTRTMQATVRWLVRAGECYHSSWSPDGRRVACSWKPPNRELYQLHLLNVDVDEKPKLLPGQDSSRNNCDPDWSPDGKTIVFSSQAPF